MNDFEYQLRFVCDAAWRMVEMQDRDALSPSHGCFHYAYWRDKTSEFPDARFQEAGAAVGLLSLSRFDDTRGPNGLPAASELYRSFSAALRFWEASQYPEGCWDEWYKGERGFAATEFTMIAYGLASRYLGEQMDSPDRQRLADTMLKAGRWLAPRHDRVKANHEAAAAAALALAWEVTGVTEFRDAAQEKIQDTLARQTDEGWFPEVGGMDLGYCSVLLDYVMIYVDVTGDHSPVPAMTRLVGFMLPFIHPDVTVSPEAGLCLNPYVSRLGFCLLAAQGDPTAAAIIATLKTTSPGRGALSTFLADDLRLLRWSYLPVVTGFVYPADSTKGASSLADFYPAGWTVRNGSAIAAHHSEGHHVYFSVAGGGAVRVYMKEELICEDLGVDIVSGDSSWGSAGYQADRSIVRTDTGVGFESPMSKAAFVYPGFLPRLILRLGSITPVTSRLLRRAIDRYRLRNSTAINQSAAPVAGGGSRFLFAREVSVDGAVVEIVDRIVSKQGAIGFDELNFKLSFSGERYTPPADTWRESAVRIVKRISVSNRGAEFYVRVLPGTGDSAE